MSLFNPALTSTLDQIHTIHPSDTDYLTDVLTEHLRKITAEHALLSVLHLWERNESYAFKMEYAHSNILNSFGELELRCNFHLKLCTASGNPIPNPTMNDDEWALYSKTEALLKPLSSHVLKNQHFFMDRDLYSAQNWDQLALHFLTPKDFSLWQNQLIASHILPDPSSGMSQSKAPAPRI